MSNIENKDIFFKNIKKELSELESNVLNENPIDKEEKPEVSEDSPASEKTSELDLENSSGKDLFEKTRMMEEVPAGVASKIPQDLRLDRLFPDPNFKLPENDEEKKKYEAKKKEYLKNIDMEKYLKEIAVDVISLDKAGKPKSDKIKLKVHKKLANELIAAFGEIKEKTEEEIKKKTEEEFDRKWNINPIDTVPKIEKGKKINPYGSYVKRNARGSDKLSVHAYGAAIDINQTSNLGEYGKGDKEDNQYYITDAFAQIMKDHGFYRGKERVNAKKDPMHFSYTEKPDPIEK